MLEINYSLFIQIANFLLLILVMNVLLYRPIRKILGRRKDEILSFEEMIGDFQGKSGQYEKDLDGNRIDARKTGFKEREGLLVEAFEEEKKILEEASSSAEDRIGKARKEVERKLEEARQSLQSEVAGFSRELAEKILGRSI